MIYEIGTISTKANDPKITGKNTLWKNSVTKVSVGQIILIQSGNTIYQNSIRSVESDTQMTLSFPVPVALTDVKYVISITMIGSVSDGVNKATAMVTESYQLMMILNRLMTESGVIKVVLPDGTEMQLRTEKERDRLLDGKFDKNGGDIKGNVTAEGDVASKMGTYLVKLETRGNKTSIVSSKDYERFNIHTLQEKSGALMHVGDFGWAGVGDSVNLSESEFISKLKSGIPSQITRNDYASSNFHFQYSAIAYFRAYSIFTTISASQNGAGVKVIGGDASQQHVYNLLTDKNTTKDAQGNLRAASPIVKVFADHIETNDESEGVTLEKLGVGRYKLKGVLGMNSDASWGGYNGGIVIPKGINGLELVWADYKVLADGDIILETHYRKHADLPPPVVLNRLIAYPEFMDENGNELESYTPCDIPNGHWIDIRVQMPNDSIYNQKQTEAQRLAKLEAERLAQEEAKRAAEEAERTEQEADI
ncbi:MULTISPECIES: phage tail fiber protein [unclassified Providencia]|uniref:phage tail fiber protein n=1 Tax=unclassified Providencia TaxID=2633465 RepID=UPI00234B1C45|nr:MULTISPECIES: hypothetical protein [unclassified Providencia]